MMVGDEIYQGMPISLRVPFSQLPIAIWAYHKCDTTEMIVVSLYTMTIKKVFTLCACLYHKTLVFRFALQIGTN